MNETVLKVGRLRSRIANNEGGIDQLGRDLSGFKQQTQSNFSKVDEQLENLRLEFKEFKANLSAVANVTEDVNQLKQIVKLMQEEIGDIEDKLNGKSHRLSISVGYNLSLIFLVFSSTNL